MRRHHGDHSARAGPMVCRSGKATVRHAEHLMGVEDLDQDGPLGAILEFSWQVLVNLLQHHSHGPGQRGVELWVKPQFICSVLRVRIFQMAKNFSAYSNRTLKGSALNAPANNSPASFSLPCA